MSIETLNDTSTTHKILAGRVQLRKRGRVWWYFTSVGGKRFRKSTNEESLQRAMEIAEDGYLTLRGKLRDGELVGTERTFGQVAELYLRDILVLGPTNRSKLHIELCEMRLRVHVLPFFKNRTISSINRGVVQAYCVHRTEQMMAEYGRPPARSTIMAEITQIRQVLQYAVDHGWLPFVPNFSIPYLKSIKRSRRAWFSPEEYKQLYTATRRRITEGKRPGYKSHYEDMHDFVLFMANTGLRPDEALKLELRDVKVEDDYATRETILVIDVRGKRGVGYCKSTKNAVHPFERLRERRKAELRKQGKTDAEITTLLPFMRLFPRYDRHLFNTILDEEGLRFDRDGQRRSAYSLRHTYISMRLMEGANIHQIANNCRTSVKMIEEFYAAHIKDRLDAAAINVMRPEPARRPRTHVEQEGDASRPKAPRRSQPKPRGAKAGKPTPS